MREKCILDIRIDKTGKRPVFLSVVDAVIGEIERGRLRPGDLLPGTRALANSLRVNRNTIDAAFHELIMQGWLVAEPSRGTFVSPQPPIARLERPSKGDAMSGVGMLNKTPIIISDGTTDTRLLPNMEFAREFRRALSSLTFLSQRDYPDPRGMLFLRNAISEYLHDERGLAASADELLVTSGSQMALYLAAMVLVHPGDVIAVENPGYPQAWAAFQRAGARVVGVPVDASGMDVQCLERIVQQEPNVKAVYITPHRQYPTTVTLADMRRQQLLALAKRHRLTIIEDDYDHEFNFEGPPILPLAAHARTDLNIVYIGSFSKILASSIRMGYVVGRGDLILEMAQRRDEIDRGGTAPIQQAIASLIADGEIRRHVRKVRRIYEDRRNTLIDEINTHFPDYVDFTVPSGGLAIWLQLKQGLSAADWARNAALAGVMIPPGMKYSLDPENPREAFRIGFANFDESEMRSLVKILAKTMPTRTMSVECTACEVV